MNPLWIRATLAAALLAAAPARAASDLEPPDLARYLRWGPLRVRPGIALTNVGYDDNILVSGANEVSDYTATLTPKLEGLVLFGHRAFLTFEEKLEFTFYQDNTDQNFHNQKGTARLTLPMSRMGFYVDGILNSVRERPIDQEDIRPERDREALKLGVIFRPAWRAEMEIALGGTEWSYRDDDDPSIDERLDRREDRLSLAADYRLLGRTDLTLDAYIESIDFDDVSAQGKDSREWSVLAGFDFGEGGSLSGSARLGWAEIDPQDVVFGKLQELVGDVELAYRPRSHLTLRLNGEREPGFSVTGSSPFFLSTSIDLRAIYYFNRLLGVEAAGGAGKLDFSGSVTGDTREDDLRRYEAGIRFRISENALGRRVEYRLNFKRSRRQSTEPSQNTSRGTFGLDLVVGF